MEREKIIEKIKNLREHSVERGATEAEAIAFALKAQKFIADNDIEEWELGEECNREVIELEADTSIKRAWRKMLLAVVADNFRCKAVITKRYDARYKVVQIPTFIGYRNDAEAAALVFEHLLKVGHKLGKRHENDFYTDPDAYENFVRGFTEGVKSELEKQSQALMLVVPNDVREYVNSLDLKRCRAARRIGYSEASRSAGFSAGRDAVRSRRMGSGGGKLLQAM